MRSHPDRQISGLPLVPDFFPSIFSTIWYESWEDLAGTQIFCPSRAVLKQEAQINRGEGQTGV